MNTTDPDLKKRLLDNQFLIRLRCEGVIDQKEYEALRDGIVELTGQWKGQTLVDKELAQLLYILAPVCHNMADTFPERREWSEKVHDCAIELDALVIACLATPATEAEGSNSPANNPQP